MPSVKSPPYGLKSLNASEDVERANSNKGSRDAFCWEVEGLDKNRRAIIVSGFVVREGKMS